MQTIIRAEHITRAFGNLKVLKGVNLEVKQGEILAITGPSGAGKSTLLHIIGTIDKPNSGRVVIDGVEVHTLPEATLAGFRNRKLGFVFQFHHLLPEFTALENVCIPAYISGMRRPAAHKRAHELLTYLGLTGRAEHKPSELSGGEQQRVAVARALMNNPPVVLADEPSGNLDSRNAEELHQMFFGLRERFGTTFVIVTHNPALAGMADRTLGMRDGVFETD